MVEDVGVVQEVVVGENMVVGVVEGMEEGFRRKETIIALIMTLMHDTDNILDLSADVPPVTAPFNEPSGPRIALTNDSSPLDFFSLFFDDEYAC